MKRLFFAVSIALTLSSCTTAETPAQKVFAASSAYDTALTVAINYKQLPVCGQSTSPIVCSDKEVVATLQRADNVAFEGIKAAQAIVRNPTTTVNAKEVATTWAKEAVTSFTKILTLLKVK